MSAWYDAKTKQEIVSIKMFEKLEVDLALPSSCSLCMDEVQNSCESIVMMYYYASFIFYVTSSLCCCCIY